MTMWGSVELAIKAVADAIKTVVDAIQAVTDTLTNVERETEYVATPAIDQVASASATSLTAGVITPTYPTGATLVRALLVASLHAANTAANTHNISIKVQGKKANGAYGDLIDLTAQTAFSLVNVNGADDSIAIPVNVTTLIDASGAAYSFKFIIDSDNAGAVNYVSSFALVLVYRI